MNLSYELVRSKRRTLSIHIGDDGTLTARAPLKMPKSQIDAFILSKEKWIKKALEKTLVEKEKARAVAKELDGLSADEIIQVKKKLSAKLDGMLEYYCGLANICYNRASLSNAKTRWGSCNAKGNLKFSWKLAFCPDEVIEYIVLHELCHIKQMNHGKKFWALVEQYMPDYRSRRGWLKENNHLLQ